VPHRGLQADATTAAAAATAAAAVGKQEVTDRLLDATHHTHLHLPWWPLCWQFIPRTHVYVSHSNQQHAALLNTALQSHL
jgi:hypothetical protein